jgi:peptidoglycan/LPS O-acetylase OafA/YrhL
LLASAPLLVVAFRLEGLFFLEKPGVFAYAFLSLVTAAIVLAASLCAGRALAFVAPRPLAFVGVASYGVFLYHQLAIGLCDLDRASPPSWTNLARTAALALALSVLVGQTSWVAIERPLMRLAVRSKLSARRPMRSM